MVDEILPPPPPEPPTESAWERGLRHAKEVRAHCVLGEKHRVSPPGDGRAQRNCQCLDPEGVRGLGENISGLL